MQNDLDLKKILEIYKKTLINDVVPFWMKYAIDNENGAIFNCLADDGSVESTNKYLWSQGRALWTFSALYNRIKNKEEWLNVACSIKDFLLTYGRDDEGAWIYELNQYGEVVTGAQSVYIDAFVILGMVEFARATGDKTCIELALNSYNRVKPLLDNHETLKTEPNLIPEGLEHHGPKMIYALVSYELGLFLKNKNILEDSLVFANKIIDEHYDKKERLLREFISHDREIRDYDAQNTVVPGHVAETTWFLMNIYRHWGMEKKIKLVTNILRRHLEFGWDEKYGGILLAKHIKGGQPKWYNPDAKVWWVFTESMYALLLAYELTNQDWCLDWYWKVHDYAFDKFPNKEHGDWHQNLDRKGNQIPVVLGLKVKDPFHLPRCLILGIECIERMLKKNN